MIRPAGLPVVVEVFDVYPRVVEGDQASGVPGRAGSELCLLQQQHILLTLRREPNVKSAQNRSVILSVAKNGKVCVINGHNPMQFRLFVCSPAVIYFLFTQHINFPLKHIDIWTIA